MGDLHIDISSLTDQARHIKAHRDHIAGTGVEILLNLYSRQCFVVNGDEFEYALPESVIGDLVTDDQELVVQPVQHIADILFYAELTVDIDFATRRCIECHDDVL